MPNPIKRKPAHEPDATLHAAVYAIESGLEALTASMTATRDAVSLKGAEAKQLTGSNQRITTSSTRLMGFAVHETTDGASAELLIRNGDGGDVLMVVSLYASESAREWFGPGGIALTAGVSVEVAGGIEGSIFVGGA